MARSLSTNPTSVYERERRRRLRAADVKVCRYCGDTKARAEFVTYTDECLACRSVGKSCGVCGQRKPASEFYAERRRPDGLMAACRSCHRATVAKRRYRRMSELVVSLGVDSGWTCYLCGEAMGADDVLEVDHVVPIALGGDSERANLALVHRACNRRKADHHPSRLTWVAPTAAAIVARAVARSAR